MAFSHLGSPHKKLSELSSQRRNSKSQIGRVTSSKPFSKGMEALLLTLFALGPASQITRSASLHQGQTHVIPTTSLSRTSRSGLAKMKASEPIAVSGSFPQMDGVLLVTGQRRDFFAGRTQIVFGIMDTVVRDPFSKVAPKFFQMAESELEDAINASAWTAFECGEIDEAHFQKTFFKDGRDFNLENFKSALVEGYELTDGIAELLNDLQDVGHKLHGFTDYPEWYTLIEDKLALEAKHGLQWTSVSCDHGLRKCEPAAYLNLLRRLGSERKLGAAPILLIDSKAEHCEAAAQLGISSVQFQDSVQLRKALGDILGSRKRGTAPKEGWPKRVMR